MNKLILMISILLATSVTITAHADEDDENEASVTPADIVLEKDFPASAKARDLHVTIHKAGHLEDRPFVVEVDESCAAPGSTGFEPRAIDSYSACDVAPNTLEFNAQRSELAMLVRQPASDGTCSVKPKKIVMQLETMCD